MKALILMLAAVTVGCSRPAPGGGGDASTSTTVQGAPSQAGGRMGHGMMGGRMGHGMMGGASGGMPMMAGAARADTSAAPNPKATQAGPSADCPPVSQELVDGGRTVFSGAGNCYACHGANAKGTAMAPDLTDATWLNIDGSYASIIWLVRSGVARPRQHPAPMPALGGAALNRRQLCAVAAYVYSLSHR